eukprot:scaffold56259_cov64-Phaeocystis_antarctica.AAC.5
MRVPSQRHLTRRAPVDQSGERWARRAARAKLDERAGRGFVGYTVCASEPESATGGAATMT